MQHIIKNIIKCLALLPVGILFTGTSFGQTCVNTAGGDASGSGGSVSYSIGQAVYTANSGSSGMVEQGVQHAYQISELNIPEGSFQLAMTVFPIPTSDQLSLQIKDYTNEKWSYQLLDIQGNLISNHPINSAQTTIDMSEVAGSTYFLNVLNQEKKQIQSFKIIKN